jgi:hypothetical protein
LVFATRGKNKQAAIYLKSKGTFEWLQGDEVDAVVKAIKDIRLKSKKLIVLPVATPENA